MNRDAQLELRMNMKLVLRAVDHILGQAHRDHTDAPIRSYLDNIKVLAQDSVTLLNEDCFGPQYGRN